MLLSVIALTPSPSPTTPGRIEQITEQIANRQSPTPNWLVLFTGLLALLFVGTSIIRRVATSSHEGAHATAAGMMGQVSGITLPLKGSAFTTVQVTGFASFLTLFIGYLGPPLFGLLGAWLLSRDHPVAVLWLAIVLFGVVLWLIKNPFGAFFAAAIGGVLLLVAWNTTLAVQTVVAYFLVWSLLLRGSRHVSPYLAAAARKMDPKAKEKSDYRALREMTYVPQIIYVVVHLALCWSALAFGAWLMLVA
ncbi:M50 family metallopeptidase [Cryptosporangium sp. NPDC048952]|uniref:M50 family metallopeptidase n=1 Tax=Cryptosporangium sp. NPDC048952 TaxID=3363961 RepID=UPI003717A190